MLLNFRKAMDIPSDVKVIDHIGPMTKGNTFLLATVALLGVAALVTGILAKLDYVKLPPVAMNETAFRAMIGGGGTVALMGGVPLVVLMVKEYNARKYMDSFSGDLSEGNIATEIGNLGLSIRHPSQVATLYFDMRNANYQLEKEARQRATKGSPRSTFNCCGLEITKAGQESHTPKAYQVPQVQAVISHRYKSKSDLKDMAQMINVPTDKTLYEKDVKKILQKTNAIMDRMVKEVHVFANKAESEAFVKQQEKYWKSYFDATSREILN